MRKVKNSSWIFIITLNFLNGKIAINISQLFTFFKSTQNLLIQWLVTNDYFNFISSIYPPPETLIFLYDAWMGHRTHSKG